MPNVAFLGKPIVNGNSDCCFDVKKIAQILAQQKWSIICDDDELMKANLFEIAKENNVKFTVITNKNTILNDNLIKYEVIKVENQLEKIKSITDIADIIIIFPGGTEALFELSTIWVMLEQNMIYKKIIITIGEMWDEIVQLISFYDEQAYESGLLMKNAKDVNEAITFVEDYIQLID
jgi:predicted Rossmann-fold nucleotide-binding protein